MPHITCSVATRGRYHLTLPTTLQSIISQQRPPDKFILVDDNTPEERTDLRKDPVLTPLLSVMARRCKDGVEVLKGPNRGPHANHELVRKEARELVWRVDDDECPMPDVLGRLERFFTGKEGIRTGAACGCVHNHRIRPNPYASSALPILRSRKNVQWFTWPEGTVMDNLAHIHSTYLYRAQAGTFIQDYSPVGHTEETRHTLNMKMMGFRLFFDADAVTMHYRQPSGGIRSASKAEMWQRDETNFNKWCDSLPVDWVMPVDFIPHQGVGDAFALRKALPKILSQYEKDRKRFEIRMFPRKELMPIFEDMADRFDIFLPHDKLELFHSTDDWNIYHHMSKNNLKGLDTAYIDYYNPDRRR